MKAIVMAQPGDPEVLTLQEIPDVSPPTSTQIAVRLRAAGINPLDTKLRQRGPLVSEGLPTILGCDGAGIVTDRGSAVTRFQVGDEVYFFNGGIGADPGTYAEAVTIDEQWAAHKPASLSFLQAAAAPLVLITAWESLHDRGRIQADQQVLIHGGAGGVGHVAIQLARIAGARVCTTVGSAKKAAFVRNLRVDEFILYKQQDFVEKVLEWTQGEGVDLALDTVGGSTLFKTLHCIRPYGDLVMLLMPKPDQGNWQEARVRNLRVSYEWMPAPMFKGWTQARIHQRWILEQCAQLFDTGQLQIAVDQIFPLAEAAEAHRYVEQESVLGKVVLEIP